MEEVIGLSKAIIASRKKRLLSFIVDILILGIVGYISGLFFEKDYIKLGGFGRLIGFLITLSYFSLFDSKICNGQTIGKKIFKIKVVDKKNETISLKTSIIRSIFYSLTVLLSGISFLSYKYITLIIIIGITLFSIYAVEAYLFIFNKNTKQTLHDVISKTYVVDDGSSDFIDIVNNKRVLKSAIIFPILISVLVIGINFKMENTRLNEMHNLVNSIQNQLPINNTTVSRGITKYSGTKNFENSNYIFIDCKKINQDDNSEDLSLKIAEIVLKSNIEFRDKESLIIQISTGYDIAIARKYHNQKYNLLLVDWKNKIEKTF